MWWLVGWIVAAIALVAVAWLWRLCKLQRGALRKMLADKYHWVKGRDSE